MARVYFNMMVAGYYVTVNKDARCIAVKRTIIFRASLKIIIICCNINFANVKGLWIRQQSQYFVTTGFGCVFTKTNKEFTKDYSTK